MFAFARRKNAESDRSCKVRFGVGFQLWKSLTLRCRKAAWR